VLKDKISLVKQVKKQNTKLTANDVKNEIMMDEMAELRQEIAEVRKEKAVLSYLFSNATKQFNCSETASDTTLVELELLKDELKAERKDKKQMLETLSEEIADLKMNCSNDEEPKRKVVLQKSIPQNSEVPSVRTALLSTNAEFTCQEGEPRYSVEDMSFKLVESLNLGTEPPDLVCDIDCDRNTWIVIQRRLNGSLEFNCNFEEYKNGFGSLNHEFWLGLEAIHHLTKNNKYKLRIDLEDWKGIKWFAEYDEFSVGHGDGYELNVHGYHGNIKSYSVYSFERLSGMRFTTKDKDQDKWRYNCASYRYNNKYIHSGGGGWWYQSCSQMNLNGKYYDSQNLGEVFNANPSHSDGMFWNTNKPTGMLSKYSFKTSQMKIRLKD